MVTIQIPNINNKKRIEFRSFREKALKCSEEELIEFKANFQLSPCNPNENANNFIGGIISNLNTNLPIIEKIEKIKNLNTPWITSRLVKMIDKKHRIFKNHCNNLISYDDYKIFRNLVTKALVLAKKIYLSEKFLNASQKESWKIINNLKSNNQKSQNITLKLNNNLTLDTNSISAAFIDYFWESIMELTNNMTSINPQCLFQSNPNHFEFGKITLTEVVSALNNLKNNNKHKSKIPTIWLKFLAPHLAPMLVSLYNNIVENAVYPDIFKVGRLKPIHKSGEKTDISKYRPIVIIDPFAKILEYLFHNKITYFFNSENLFSPEQYGFTKGKSIEHATLSFLHDAYEANRRNQCFGAVFIDLSKAFDTINHEILAYKLNNYGIRGKNLQLLKSYLTNRSNYVQIGPSKSQPKTFLHGVPQGSSLGPLLFNIFINDISKVIEHRKIILYADDILLYVSCNNINELKESLNKDLENISAYFKINNLIFNILKTKVMLFFKYCKLSVNLTIDSQPIEQVNEFKYLGLIIDSKLSFKSHILEINKKLNQCNRNILYLRKFLSTQILIKLYYSFGYSHLSLHILAWGGTFPSYLRPLSISLNKIVRNIHLNSSFIYINTENCFQNLNLLNINAIFKIKLGQFIFLTVSSKSPIPQNIIENLSWSHSHDTRRNQLKVPNIKNSVDKHSFVYHTVILWNNSNVIKNISNYNSVKTFKNDLQIEILENAL